MTQQPQYAVSYCLSWGLTMSGGVMAVLSVLAYFLPESVASASTMRLMCVIAFASMVGFSVACGNCTAAAAQHAASSGTHRATFWLAIICTIGFCVVTGIGVHLGWELMTHGVRGHGLPPSEVVVGASIFVAVAKPAMQWIIEGRKAIDRDALQAEQAEESKRLEEARQRDRDIAKAHNVTRLVRGAALAAGASALLGAPHAPADAAQMVQQDRPNEAPQKRTERLTDSSPQRAEARRLILEGKLSNRAIARQTGVSPSTVDRDARELRAA